jgi:tetratricopeptide (TPR) repeat protein
MPGTRWANRALIPFLLVATAGCAWFDRSQPLNVQPVQLAPTAGSPDDTLYDAAVRAISVRDYATALDYLQAARQKQSDDIRVLNAFGVVYDKLGRFDLSARYYAEAQMLDPKSAIVAANLAWSVRLQETASAIPSEIALARVAPPAPETGAMEMAFDMDAGPTPPRVRVAAAPNPVSPVPISSAPTGAKKPVLTGHPLVIINASGQSGASEPVRQRLASRGWTAPRWAMSDGAQQIVTTIAFASLNATAAHALARTLPFPSHLVTCEDRCTGVRLVLGRDFLNPRTGKPASAGAKRS